jgi:hypothetical protein
LEFFLPALFLIQIPIHLLQLNLHRFYRCILLLLNKNIAAEDGRIFEEETSKDKWQMGQTLRAAL